MQNKQQIDLIKLPKFKIQKFPPRFQSGKTNRYQEENMREYFKKENYRQQKFPSYVVISRDWHLLPGVRQILAYLKQIRPLHIFRKAWHITHHRILFKGISRIGAHPKSHLDVFSTAPPPLSPHMDPSFHPWQTAFKWLTYKGREFAGDGWHGN